MFERISKGWALVEQSGAVLRSEKKLLVLPALSGAALVAVLVSFAVPFFMALAAAGPHHAPQHAQPLHAALLFGFYFVSYFVMAFFNAALVSCVTAKLDGEVVSIRAGLRAAGARLPQILGWGLLSASVGTVLRLVAERSGLIGRFVLGLFGMAWSAATYFTVPVLVLEGVGPVAAVHRSAAIVKKMWGEAVVANVSIGAISGLAMLAAFSPVVAGAFLAGAAQSAAPLIAGAVATVGLIVAVALVSSTLNTIALTAAYRTATDQTSSAFDDALLRELFRVK